MPFVQLKHNACIQRIACQTCSVLGYTSDQHLYQSISVSFANGYCASVLVQLLQAYNGFNLIVGDFQQHKLAYFSNRSGQAPHELSPGLYGISNGVLESKWPKVEAGKARLRFLLDQTTNVQQLDAETVFQTVMGDTAKVNQNEHLPQTGMSVEIEQLMSSIFIEPCELKGAAYGTRSQTLLLVQRDGVAQLHEHSRPAQRPEEDSCFPWVKVNHTFSWG